MTYAKQNFTKGQVLEHFHLNNIEDGLVALGEGYKKLIDVTLEEEVACASTDVDVDGNAFSVKDIIWRAYIPAYTLPATGYFGVGKVGKIGLPESVGYLVNPSSTTDIYMSGMYSLCGTTLHHVVCMKGTGEFNGSFLSPYGRVMSGFDIGQSEITEISAGLTNASLALPVGTRIIVWGR